MNDRRTRNSTRARRFGRRALLAGAGASVALPYFESLRTARAEDAEVPLRFMGYFIPNGAPMERWRPTGTGAGYTLSPILASLEPFRERLLVLSGMEQTGRGHSAAVAGMLSGTQLPDVGQPGQGDDSHQTISLDQLYAQHLGLVTSLPSLEVALEGQNNSGSCNNGFPCSYGNNISWAGPSAPMPKIIKPTIVYERLFAGLDPDQTAEEQARRRALRASVLDYSLDQASDLRTRLNAPDRVKLEQYLDSVRDVELRLDSADLGGCAVPEAPEDDVEDIDARIRLMTDLMVLALTCDRTRSATFMLGRGISNRSLEVVGRSGAHHALSHDTSPEAVDALTAYVQWEIGHFGRLLQGLADAEEEDGTSVLDNSAIYLASDVSHLNNHSRDDAIAMIAGGASGGLATGRHVVFPDAPRTSRLLLTLAQVLGTGATSFGEANQPLGTLVSA